MDVLVLLLNRSGEVVSVDELIREVWGGRIVEESAVHQAISKIRRALGDDSHAPSYLESIPRRGYRLIAPSGPIEEAGRFKRSRLAVAAALLLTLLVGLGMLTSERWSQPAQPLSDDASVAVLPLANLSGDGQQDYLAEGTTELLITELAKNPSLRVISRLSVLPYASSAAAPERIARELGVAGVVTGAISRAGERIVLSVSLIESGSGALRWSERFDESEVDMPGVHQRIAARIAAELVPTASSVSTPVTRHMVPAAYDDYLRAVQLASASTADSVRSWGPEVIARLERVLALDPELVDAWALLANVHAELDVASGIRGTGARRAATQALRLDPNSSAAHAAMGYVRLNSWDFPGAGESFRRAVALGPNNPRALVGYARYLLDVEGRIDEALAVSARVPLLDPFNPYLARERAELLWAGRRFEQALAESRSIRAQFPDVFTDVEWVVYLALGRYDKAREILKALLLKSCTAPCEWAGEATRQGLAAPSYEGSWRAWKAAAAQHPEGQRRSLAIVATWLGEPEEAIGWLEAAFAHQEPLMYTLRARHLFDPLREDPRFDALLERLAFPDAGIDAGVLAGQGKVLAYQARSDEALSLLDAAMAASPDDDRLSAWLYSAALAHFAAGADDQVLDAVQRALSLDPGHYTTQNLRLLEAAALGQLGDRDAARLALARVHEQWPELSPEVLPLPPLAAAALRNRYQSGLDAAGFSRGASGS